MSTVLEAPEQAAVIHDRHAFNEAVWDKLVADPELARLPYRIETDEHGQIIMSPPPAPSHGSNQSEIVYRLRQSIQNGKVITECPISTRKGVKAADVAWCSREIWDETVGRSFFRRAPEICVEVLSPSNTPSEIAEKKTLYFEEGAREVWLVGENGEVEFFRSSAPDAPVPASAICADFPNRI
ncbi:MAG: Uma2 family endonuclease [Verrucomicrobiae bacterium]|nr:Uma2 family endonuclease [Verrucomicrobiae bacterium]